MRELLQTLVATTGIKMQRGSISVFWLSSVNVLVLVEWPLDPTLWVAKMNPLSSLLRWLIYQKMRPPPICSHGFQMFWILLKENQCWALEIWRWKRSSFFYEWPPGMGNYKVQSRDNRRPIRIRRKWAAREPGEKHPRILVTVPPRNYFIMIK